MPFNVQLNYKIYNKNAVLRVAYPKDIRFFYTNTEGTSYGRPEGLPSVVKEVGSGAKPLQIKNLKIFSDKLKSTYSKITISFI